jgi:hypothetical protein
MRYPHLIIVEADGWIARHLGELIGENRWLLREPKSSDNALSLACEARPGVVVVQFEPSDEKPAAFALIADVHRLCPDVPVVAVSDVKLTDADKAAWTATLMDLGARYVLFPPLSRPVLEDVVSGLMAASVRRVMGSEQTASPTKPDETVIDLADEENAE